MKKLYLLLAIAGFVLPYYFFVSFLIANGLDLPLFFSQLFASDISTLFAADLVVATLVFWAFLYREAGRCQMRHWWIYVVATLAVGLSFALPLFLFCRERQMETAATDVLTADS